MIDWVVGNSVSLAYCLGPSGTQAMFEQHTITPLRSIEDLPLPHASHTVHKSVTNR